MLMLLFLIFSALLLASLSSFFWPRALAFVRPVLLSALVSRLSPAPWLVSRRCSVSNGSAPMRLVGIILVEGFACAHLRPITAISSAQSRGTGRFISQSSTWLLVGKAGWLASGTRGRLICQLRQFGPPLCGPPYRRPPAESSHGSHARRALFQELLEIYIYIIQFFSLFLLGYSVPDRTGTSTGLLTPSYVLVAPPPRP